MVQISIFARIPLTVVLPTLSYMLTEKIYAPHPKGRGWTLFHRVGGHFIIPHDGVLVSWGS